MIASAETTYWTVDDYTSSCTTTDTDTTGGTCLEPARVYSKVDIEDFTYAHEERDYFNFLFVRSMFFYRRLMFSVSGWLGRKARAKKA